MRTLGLYTLIVSFRAAWVREDSCSPRPDLIAAWMTPAMAVKSTYYPSWAQWQKGLKISFTPWQRSRLRRPTWKIWPFEFEQSIAARERPMRVSRTTKLPLPESTSSCRMCPVEKLHAIAARNDGALGTDSWDAHYFFWALRNQSTHRIRTGLKLLLYG